jgi:hypothetical protein
MNVSGITGSRNVEHVSKPTSLLNFLTSSLRVLLSNTLVFNHLLHDLRKPNIQCFNAVWQVSIWVSTSRSPITGGPRGLSQDDLHSHGIGSPWSIHLPSFLIEVWKFLTMAKNFFFYFIHCLGVIKPQSFGSLFYFHLQVIGGQKPNWRGSLVELVWNLGPGLTIIFRLYINTKNILIFTK